MVADHLGAPRMLLDEAGEVAWKGQLDVYGAAEVAAERTRCPWRWPGQYEDEETGLYYNRFRYYDPSLGRYLSQDPIGLVGGLRLYNYLASPLTRTDPLGLVDPWDILFSQDSIGDHFLHGPWKDRPLGDAIHEATRIGRLPKGLELAVMDYNNELVTLNNRTLFVAQEAGLIQVHPKDVGVKGHNRLRKLLGDKDPLPRGVQPRVRTCKR